MSGEEPDLIRVMQWDAQRVGITLGVLVLVLGIVALFAEEFIGKASPMAEFITNPSDEIVITGSAAAVGETRTVQVWLPDKASNPLIGKVVCVTLTGLPAEQSTQGGGAGKVELTVVEDTIRSPTPTLGSLPPGRHVPGGSGYRPTRPGARVDVIAYLTRPKDELLAGFGSSLGDELGASSSGETLGGRSDEENEPIEEDQTDSNGGICSAIPVVGTGTPFTLRLEWQSTPRMKLGTYLGQIVAVSDGKEYVVLPVRIVVAALGAADSDKDDSANEPPPAEPTADAAGSTGS